MTDKAAVEAVVSRVQPHVVINAAAYTRVDEAEGDAAAAFAINAHGVSILAEATRRIDARLVHISTDFVFDGQNSRAYRPDDRRNPLSVYGRSKAAGEDALEGGDLLIRTAWVYSATGRNFLTTMIGLMRERSRLGVVADQIGSPTWAPRLAEIIWILVQREASGVHHYADAGVASWFDFATAIAEEAFAAGLLPRQPLVEPITTADYPVAAARPSFSVLDCSATLAAAEVAPVHWRHNLRQALLELAD